MADVTGLDVVGLPVVTVVRPNSKSLSVTQGKGLTLAAARLSGLMESIETWHAEDIALLSALLPYADMKDCALDIALCPARSQISQDESILWHEADDFSGGKKIWVPCDLLHTDYTLPVKRGTGHFIADTAGLASGSSKPQAMAHGLCEVIERDALALWLAQNPDRQAARKIKLETIEDPDCRMLLQRFNDAGIACGLWDISCDTAVCAIMCRIVQEKGAGVFSIRPAYGSACHPDRNIAALKAMMEAAQSRLTFISGARDDQYRAIYERNLLPETLAAWQREIAVPSSRDFQDCPHAPGVEVTDLLKVRLAAIGFHQIICADLARAPYNIPVVKIIVPGLENVSAWSSRRRSERFLRAAN